MPHLKNAAFLMEFSVLIQGMKKGRLTIQMNHVYPFFEVYHNGVRPPFITTPYLITINISIICISGIGSL